MKTRLNRNALCAVAALTLLAACDGDSRPFEEAVEISELNIRSLSVIPPDSTVDELYLNIGESIAFGVQGLNTAAQTVELEATDRQWQVSDSSVAQIDENGTLLALANGAVDVWVEIGGVVSDTFSLNVSDADLVGVDSILGDTIVERCVAADYQARGLYDDGTIRDLVAVDWTLADADTDNARLVSSPDINVTLTGLNATIVTLSAALDGFSGDLDVEISDSLAALAITPDTGSVDVDDTAAFVATGSYSGVAPGSEAVDDGTLRQIDVTSEVDWSIVTGAGFASVSNTTGTKGQVTGLEAGSATLSANCGTLAANSVVITVTESVVDSLSFSQGTFYTLDPDDDDGVILLVSSGTTYDANDQIDNEDLEWEFTASGDTDAIELSTEDDDEPGLIVPLVESGLGTVTVTHSNGTSASIIIEVSDS